MVLTLIVAKFNHEEGKLIDEYDVRLDPLEINDEIKTLLSEHLDTFEALRAADSKTYTAVQAGAVATLKETVEEKIGSLQRLVRVTSAFQKRETLYYKLEVLKGLLSRIRMYNILSPNSGDTVKLLLI